MNGRGGNDTICNAGGTLDVKTGQGDDLIVSTGSGAVKIDDAGGVNLIDVTNDDKVEVKTGFGDDVVEIVSTGEVKVETQGGSNQITVATDQKSELIAASIWSRPRTVSDLHTLIQRTAKLDRWSRLL